MKKIKIEIKHYITGAILFEYESEDNNIKKTVEKAVEGGANLSGADLSGANLRYADLSGADLRYANLSGANLYDADLSGADLRYANLSGANLYDANLYDANLRYANLSGADGLDYWWHVHHEILYEILTEPIKNRINYIKTDKPKNEVELRLKLLKPVLGDIPTTEAGWKKLHKEECGCGFNKTIFTKKNEKFIKGKIQNI